MFVGMFACRPVESFWNPFLEGASCINLGLFYRINTPIILALDVIALVIPWRPLWSLQASKAKKLGMICVFLTGGLGMLGCIARWVTQLRYQTYVFIPSVLQYLCISKESCADKPLQVEHLCYQ